MIINHNISALNTYRQLGVNNSANAKSMEKLSSGLRINRAGDDAAGLAISEKMRAQVRGLDQASRNSQDGISMIQTAEGALQETHNILQRMRELATQAANDTNVDVDREEIQKEMNQLTSEINRIGNTTEFNTRKILNGDISTTATSKEKASFSAGGGIADVTIDPTSTLANENYTVDVVAGVEKTIASQDENGTGVTNIDASKASGLTEGDYRINVSTSTVKSLDSSTVAKDDGVTDISIASNSSLSGTDYEIEITRTDEIASFNDAVGLTGASSTFVADDATSLTAGTYTIESSSVASGLTNVSGTNVVTDIKVTDQAAFASTGWGGEDLQLDTSSGSLQLKAGDGTLLGDAITLDQNTQTYKVYDGAAFTGLELTIDTSMASATGVQSFDIDQKLDVKDSSNNLVGTTTIAAGTAAGTETITLTDAVTGGEGTLTLEHGGTVSTLNDGSVDANAVIAGSTTFEIANSLSAQLMDTDGTTPIGSAVNFNVGDTDVNLGSGVSFNASSDLSHFSATGTETSTFDVTSGTAKVATLQTDAGSQVSGTNTIVLSNNQTNATFNNGVRFDVGTAADGNATFEVEDNDVFTGTLKSADGTSIASEKLTADSSVDFGNGVKVHTGGTLSAGQASFGVSGVVTDGSLQMQIGANQGQSFSIDINDMRAQALKISGTAGGDAKIATGVEGAKFTTIESATNGTNNTAEEFALDVSDHESASAAIKVVNNAIESVSAQRSQLGAFQNRLEHTISNLSNASENLTAAESRIRDVDMAKEVMEMTRANILGQASQAMLAQANQKPQSVLQLLG